MEVVTTDSSQRGFPGFCLQEDPDCRLAKTLHFCSMSVVGWRVRPASPNRSSPLVGARQAPVLLATEYLLEESKTIILPKCFSRPPAPLTTRGGRKHERPNQFRMPAELANTLSLGNRAPNRAACERDLSSKNTKVNHHQFQVGFRTTVTFSTPMARRCRKRNLGAKYPMRIGR